MDGDGGLHRTMNPDLSQSNTTQQPSSTTENLANDQPQSTFLQLPPEVRNMIYRYSLIEEGPVQITASSKPPAILSTCSQIRSEAHRLWYDSNKFSINVLDFDSTLFLAFSRLLKRHGYWLILTTTFFFQHPLPMHISPWANLQKYCYAIHAKDIVPVQIFPDSAAPQCFNSRLAVMNCAQETAFAARESGMSWEMCERQLRALRQVAGHMEMMWLQ